MSSIGLGLITVLADLAPSPADVARGAAVWGTVGAELALAAAVVVMGVAFIQRRGRNNRS